jgi:hypothetical protein
LLPLRLCNRRERHFIRFLRIVAAEARVNDAANQEAERLKLSVDARGVLCELMHELKTTVPALNVLAPDAAWVSADELNLLTALKKRPTRKTSRRTEASNAPLDRMPSARVATLPHLLARAGRLTVDSDVIIASRPLISTATDVRAIAQALLAETQAGVTDAMCSGPD